MAKILDMLHRDHINIARLLDYMTQQLARLKGGNEFDAAMMYVVMHYMTHYPDIFHHPREDKVFDLLRKHDEAAGLIIEQLQREHRELADLGEELLSLYETACDDGNVNVEYMAQATESYIQLHRKHMDWEESKVFPRAKILLSEEELRKVDRQIKQREDPLFGEVTETVYSTLLRTLEAG